MPRLRTAVGPTPERDRIEERKLMNDLFAREMDITQLISTVEQNLCPVSRQRTDECAGCQAKDEKKRHPSGTARLRTAVTELFAHARRLLQLL